MLFLGRRPNQLMEAIRDKDWKKVGTLIQHHPRMVKNWSRVKLSAEREAVVMLPLHLAVSMGNGEEECLDAIEELINVFPGALGCKESSLKRTPLHLACLQEHPPAALIELLLKKHPAATMQYDHLQRLPLHYACATPKNLGTIEALINVDPEVTELRDGQGWLPLHVACHYECDLDTVQLLLHTNPDAVIALTPLDGELPYDLVNKHPHYKDKHEIMDLLKAKERYYVPTPRPFMDSFVTDNLIHPIY